MKKDMLDDEFMDKDIEDFLASYVVKDCDEEHIDETIDVLKSYMPRPKEKHVLLMMIKNELTYANKIYILASLMFIILGIFLTGKMKVSSYYIMLFTSPIPVIIGLYEIAKSRMNHMWELEKSMKYSNSIIALAKIIIVIGTSSILNIFLSLVLCNISSSINFLECMAAWIVPVSIIFSVELFIFHINSSIYVSAATSSLWIAALLTFNRFIIHFLNSSSNAILILIMAFSALIFAISTYRFYKKEKNYEGEVLWS